MTPEIKLLSFDLDDTLWPCLPTILAAEKAHFQWLRNNVPVIGEHYNIEQLREKRRALMQAHPQWMHDLSRVRLESLHQLCEEFNLAHDWVEPAFDVFYHARQKVTLFDDVRPVLDQLAQSYRLIALTNGNADIYHTGVNHWFEFAVSARQAGSRKSVPDIYWLALDQAGILPDECVHIGDDPVQDIQGAQAAGIRSVWLNRDGKSWPHNIPDPYAEIRTLFDLPKILAAIDTE